MTPGVTYFAEPAVRGRALAEQRLAYLTELYDSGRWRRFHTEVDFLVNVREAKAAVDAWCRIQQFDPAGVRLRPGPCAEVAPSAAPQPSASIVALLERAALTAEKKADRIEVAPRPAVVLESLVPEPLASEPIAPEPLVPARQVPQSAAPQPVAASAFDDVWPGEVAEVGEQNANAGLPQAAPEPIETSAPIIALLERRKAVDSQREAEARRPSLLPPVMFSTYGIGAERNLLKA